MAMRANIPFVKMTGLANDFVVVDGRAALLGLSPDDIHRATGRKPASGATCSSSRIC